MSTTMLCCLSEWTKLSMLEPTRKAKPKKAKISPVAKKATKNET